VPEEAPFRDLDLVPEGEQNVHGRTLGGPRGFIRRLYRWQEQGDLRRIHLCQEGSLERSRYLLLNGSPKGGEGPLDVVTFLRLGGRDKSLGKQESDQGHGERERADAGVKTWSVHEHEDLRVYSGVLVCKRRDIYFVNYYREVVNNVTTVPSGMLTG
jgi:hypothetical protein